MHKNNTNKHIKSKVSNKNAEIAPAVIDAVIESREIFAAARIFAIFAGLVSACEWVVDVSGGCAEECFEVSFFAVTERD
jgi:hypothetical protein